MKKILAKIILITGSILPILISPIYAETEFERKVREIVEADKRRIKEEYNKFSAAKNYGIAVCLINDKGVPREMAIERIVLFGLRQQKIDPNYYKDKRVEIMGERIAKTLDKDCARLFEYKEMKDVVNFLLVNPIKEDSNINPINYYGFSKREGEKIIEKSLSDSIIIRTSWLYSMYGSNFVKTMIKKGDNGEKIYVINDQFGCPTYAKDLVNVILSIVDSGIKPKYKVYNFSNEGYTNWYDFTKKIFELKKLDCSINPVDSENYRSIARRPKYSVLDKSRIKDTFNINIRNWEDALQELINNIK